MKKRKLIFKNKNKNKLTNKLLKTTFLMVQENNKFK